MSAEENAEAPAPPPKSKIVPLVLVANTLLLAGVLIMVMRRPNAASAAEHEGAPAPAPGAEGPLGPGPMLKLENFIIQLKTAESEARYVRVAFDLEVGSEIDKNAITARMSAVRDSIISYFADRTLDELRGSDGMEQIKVNLLKRVETAVPGRRVKAVYITDFVVQ